MDPKQIVRRGEPYDYWISEDWSQSSDTRRSGLNQVRAIDVTYADGTKQRMILDERGQPISSISDLPPDTDQERRWKDQQQQQTQAGKKEKRTFTGTDPNTGRPAMVTEYEDGTLKYDEIKPTTAQGTKEWRTEGTPDPNAPGGYDNSRPIMAAYVNGQRTGETRQPTGDELRDWRIAQQGGKTDAEIRAERDAQQAQQPTTVRVPVEGHPGIYLVTRKNPQTNQTDTIYENEAGQKVPQPAAAPSYSVSQRTINGQTYTIITKTPKDGSPPTITNYGPDGQSVSALPSEGVGNIPGLPTYVPDLTKPGAGLFEYAKQLDEFMKANPSFTWEKRQQVLEAAQKQASTVVQEFNTGAAILREQYQTNVTQRGQDMTQANNRAALANTHHQNAIGLIEKFAPYLGVTSGDAGKLFLGMMASQLATATAYGGMQNYGREEMDPRLMAFADRAVGGASRPASPTPPGTPPNALGLGDIGAAQAPGSEREDDILTVEETHSGRIVRISRAQYQEQLRNYPNVAEFTRILKVEPASAARPGDILTAADVPPAGSGDPNADMAAEVRRRHAASGAPLPTPLLGPPPNVPGQASPPPLPGGINPPAGQPGHNPTAPVGMASPGGLLMRAETPSAEPGGYPTRTEGYGLDPLPMQPTRTDGFIIEPYGPSPAPAPTPVSSSLESMFANALPPEPVSWHERAQAQASAFEQPGNVARLESLIGGAVPSGSMFGGFSMGGPVAQAPLPLASRIPGLTAEADAEARRQLAMGV